jgi:membrane-associated phospholipid phosphatase
MRAGVRTLAAAALASALLVPNLRRRRRVPRAVTAAATISGPIALAILRPRTKARDAALFALQMWAFGVVHELPYDNPESLRRRLRIRYPIRADLAIGRGTLPNARLQRALSRPGRVSVMDRGLSMVHWSWFFEPHLCLVWILVRHNERFPSAARQLAAAYDLGCLTYALVPTAPPWWASENGETPQEVERMMIPAGEEIWKDTWPRLYETFNGNPWAAMPSLHFGTSLLAALLLGDINRVAGTVGWTYALTLGFALVYLGEHYVIDLLAGAALVAVVRRGEPLVEPAALAFSRAIQRVERLANG